MDAEGLVHNGFDLAFENQRHRIDLKNLAGNSVMVYGQTELTRDLIALRLAQSGNIQFGVSDTHISDIDTKRPTISYRHEGEQRTISCDYVAGCDGFHGVSRQTIPSTVLKTYERVYPFGWLGILVERPPVAEELIYTNHPRGFALCSMRSLTRSRYYIQCGADEQPENWSDDQFWNEFETRIGPKAAAKLQRGPSFEKSIAPLRSFVVEPMACGRLFLAGDAAHIVPPTGAKGLNLAIADVAMLAHAFSAHYNHANATLLETYSQRCLRRVWKVERFSWYMSQLLHQYPEHSPFEKKMQRAEFDYIASSENASRMIAENYVGLPVELADEI
jgi:p-hydroxybenzoate 3-monooxygenase